MKTLIKVGALLFTVVLVLAIGPWFANSVINQLDFESTTQVVLIYYLLIFVPTIVLLLTAGFLYFLVDEREKRSIWQGFADTYQLKFIPGHFISHKKARITGNWHNRPMSIYGNDTRIHLAVEDSYSRIEQTLNAPIAVEEMSEKLSGNTFVNIKGWFETEPWGKALGYHQSGFEKDTSYLYSLLELLSTLADSYPSFVTLGWELSPVLIHISLDHDHPFQNVATQLLYDIEAETNSRLNNKTVLCKRCLSRSTSSKIEIGENGPIAIYGCSVCKQSRDFYSWVVVTLDSNVNHFEIEQGGTLYRNWLLRKELFNFNEVEIIQATDEDVERFAVQVGNDTNKLRYPFYKEMQCIVSPECGLSENSMRILRKMFGEVHHTRQFRINGATTYSH